MKKKAVYPGSFDPITLGHIDIVQRASKIFDKLVVLVARSDSKKCLFSSDERVSMAQACLKSLKNVSVESWDGLTVDYLKKTNAMVILRGLRSGADFEQEWVISQTNKHLNPKIETLFMNSKPDLNFIASRIVKDVAAHGGDLRAMVPALVQKKLQEKLG